MHFTQYYLDCLSQASYLIGDETTGRAVVVDPRRDVHEYVADAEAAGLRIELVIETHFHADFLSGHLELAAATGAEIAFGEAASGAEFEIRRLADGERIELGEVVLEIRSTPGHTPESISVVVWEHADDAEPFGVLTGDTLFIGDVGRPDLLASRGVTAEELASQLFASVHDRLLSLPDSTKVFPGHGAGSACGKSLSTEKVSTIGEQRRTNYALAPMTQEQFVAVVTEGQTAPPAYFPYDAQRNREDRPLLDEDTPPRALSYGELVEARTAGAVVLDTRDAASFAAGHLRESVNVGADGRFAEYVGSVIAHDTPIVLVGEPGTATDVRNRLARIGFDQVLGVLDEAEVVFLGHDEEVVRSSRLAAIELAQRLGVIEDHYDGEPPVLVDLRNPGEVAEVPPIPGAVEIPLTQLRARAGELDPARPTVVYCAGGYRSSIGASYLASLGFTDVSDLLGGVSAWHLSREFWEKPAPTS